MTHVSESLAVIRTGHQRWTVSGVERKENDMQLEDPQYLTSIFLELFHFYQCGICFFFFMLRFQNVLETNRHHSEWCYL